MSSNLEIRPARLYEAKKIAKLINDYAERNLMLKRSEESVVENIRNFIVAIQDEEIVGCCAVAFFTEELAEVRSLAVRDDLQGQGIGSSLVRCAEKILQEEGVKNAFALTRAEQFFYHLEYKKVAKTNFPQKIWRDCASCPRIMDCDEIAVMKELN